MPVSLLSMFTSKRGYFLVNQPLSPTAVEPPAVLGNLSSVIFLSYFILGQGPGPAWEPSLRHSGWPCWGPGDGPSSVPLWHGAALRPRAGLQTVLGQGVQALAFGFVVINALSWPPCASRVVGFACEQLTLVMLSDAASSFLKEE